MKMTIKNFIIFLVIVVLCGCHIYTMRTNTKFPNMDGVYIEELGMTKTVALTNTLTDAGDEQIGVWTGWKVFGNYYKFTESAIGATKNILERENVKVTNNGEKNLNLTVYDVKSSQGRVFTVLTSLRVKTGDGLVKEYSVSKNHSNGYGTTPVIEKNIAECVGQMLNDKDIVNYLVN